MDSSKSNEYAIGSGVSSPITLRKSSPQSKLISQSSIRSCSQKGNTTSCSNKQQGHAHQKRDLSPRVASPKSFFSAVQKNSNMESSTSSFCLNSELQEQNVYSCGIQPLAQLEKVQHHLSHKYFQTGIVAGPKTRSKQQFSKLGLLLETICIRDQHQRSPVLFICTERSCTSQLKTGCAYCMLEDHGEHGNESLSLDEFQEAIQNKYSQYYDEIKDFQMAVEEIETPTILSEVSNRIDSIKEQVCNRLDDIKDNIIKQYHSLMTEENLLTAEAIQRQKLFSCELEDVIKVQELMHICDEDRETCIKLLDESEIRKMRDRIREMSFKTEKISSNIAVAFNSFSLNLSYSLNKVFDRNDRLKIRHQKTDSFDEQIKSLVEIKNSILTQMQDYKQMQEQLCQLQKEISSLKIAKSTSQFPYLVYGGQCSHQNIINCNTIPIFECCDQAYPCTQCHTQQTDHLSYFTSPSRRYCINCLSIFQVDHPTNIPINCTTCLADEIHPFKH